MLKLNSYLSSALDKLNNYPYCKLTYALVEINETKKLLQAAGHETGDLDVAIEDATASFMTVKDVLAVAIAKFKSEGIKCEKSEEP